MAGTEVEMRCVRTSGRFELMRSNQYLLSCVRSAPFSGIPFERMTSYAETLSVATKRRLWSSNSKISRTLPEATFFRPGMEARVVRVVEADMMRIVFPALDAIRCPRLVQEF